MNWLKWVLSVAFIALAAGAIIVILLPKPVAVEKATVARGHFEQVVEDDGRTRVRERYTVSSPVAGHILRIDLAAGDPVTENMALATILPNPPSMLDVRTHQELEQNVGSGGSTPLAGERRPSACPIGPATGARRPIGDPADLEIVADILSTDAVSVARGAAVRIRGWGDDKPLDGRVQRVEPSAFTKVSALGVEEQRVNTIIDIVSRPQEWKALGDGFRVDVEIVTFATDDAITMPSGALFRGSDGWKVYAVEGGRARLRSIELARQSGLGAMVVSGLSPGDQVILYPSDAVRDGVKVGPG